MIAFIILSIVILSAYVNAEFEKPFVLFPTARNELTPPTLRALQFSSLATIEAQRLGLLNSAQEASEWNNVALNPFALPSHAVTFVIPDLTKDDVAQWRLSNKQLANTPQASLRSYDINVYRGLLQARKQFEHNVVSASVNCDTARDIARVSNAGADSAFCEISNDLNTLINEFNRRFETTLTCSNDVCTLVNDDLNVKLDDSVALQQLKSIIAESLLTARAIEAAERLSTPTSVMTMFDSLAPIQSSELRKFALAIIGHTLTHVGCFNDIAACSIVGGHDVNVNAGVPRNTHVRRRSAIADATRVALAVDSAYSFHLLVWVGILFALLFYLSVYIMHTLIDETEKDSLLFRNTTQTTFDNALDIQLR